MRETAGQVLSRVRGRHALERSLRSLLIRAHRFGEHRARTAADRLWAGVVIDTLRALLTPEPSAPGVPRSTWEEGSSRTSE